MVHLDGCSSCSVVSEPKKVSGSWVSVHSVPWCIIREPRRRASIGFIVVVSGVNENSKLSLKINSSLKGDR